MENESVVCALRKALLLYIKIDVLQVWKYQVQDGILCLLSNLIGCTLLVYFGLHLYLIFSGPFSCIWICCHTVSYVHAVKLFYPPVKDCIQIPYWEWILAHPNSHSQAMEKVILQEHEPCQGLSQQQRQVLMLVSSLVLFGHVCLDTTSASSLVHSNVLCLLCCLLIGFFS